MALLSTALLSPSLVGVLFGGALLVPVVLPAPLFAGFVGTALSPVTTAGVFTTAGECVEAGVGAGLGLAAAGGGVAGLLAGGGVGGLLAGGGELGVLGRQLLRA